MERKAHKILISDEEQHLPRTIPFLFPKKKDPKGPQ